MASRIAALLLLGIICADIVAAEVPLDCCLNTGEKRIPLQRIKHYIIQEAGKGCKISATMFITKGGRNLCFPHPSERPWVKQYVDYLSQRRQ